MDLDESIYASIVKLCGEGDQLAESTDLDGALLKYKEALILLPKPWFNWEASVWIFTAIGDAYFFKKY